MDIDVDAGIRLAVEIGKNTEAIKRAARIQDLARRAATPAFARLAMSGIAPASGILILGNANQLGPSQGYYWNILSISVTGPTPGVAVTGRADIYVTAASLNVTALAQLPSADWRDQSATIPNVAFYNRGQMTLRDNELIYVVCSGLTNGQQIAAGIQVEVLQEAADPQVYAI